MSARHLVGAVVVVHTEAGRLILKIASELSHPMFQVVDSSGNEFAVEAAEYEYASAKEVEAFHVERLRASENRSQWN